MIVDSVVANAKAYINKAIAECNIAIEKGKIFKIGKETNMPKADTKVDVRNLLVLPGLIDAHVHLRDEGKAYKEDFYSGTAAAAAGGFTTVLDMPNNEPVTMSAQTLRNRMEIAENKVLINVGFYSEFPKNLDQIEAILREGASSFKLFMAEQVGGLNINDDQALLDAFKTVGTLHGVTAVHAEDEATLKRSEDAFKHAGKNDVEAFLKAHSVNVEVKAVNRLLSIVDQVGMRLHFCHVSTQDGLEAIVAGKRSGLPTTCETTPHNLFLSTEDLKRIGTQAVTMPPVRDEHHRAALWDGIKNGEIDLIASDHAPHTLEEKEAESVWNVKVGIPGLETTLPLLLTEVRRGRLSVGDIVRLMAENPSEIFGLNGKGRLKEGNSADFTVVDLSREYRIDASEFYSKAKFSPFDGSVVKGKPVKTLVSGQLIMDNGEIIAKAGSGSTIRRDSF